MAIARAIGEPRGLHLALRAVGTIAALQRDEDRAMELAQEGLELATDLGEGWEWEVGKSLGILGTLRYWLGDLAHARPFLEEAIKVLRTVDDRLSVAELVGVLARVALSEGSADEARSYAIESLELSAALMSVPIMARVLDVLVRLAAADRQYEHTVRLAGAVSMMRPQAGMMSTFARPAVVDHARQQLGAARAAEVWAEGEALNTREAVALALSSGAAESAASTTPAKLKGPSLTNRELEVLRLVADGQSNREISSILVLSIRTVERHLQNVYAKIGANGRASATAYALRHSLT